MNETTAKRATPRKAAVGRTTGHTARAPARGRASAISARPTGRKRAKRARKPVNRDNLKTALWLWCFPVGLSLLWRKSCTWKRGVKIAITALMGAILITIFVFPTPATDHYSSGIQMVASNPEVEVYGPALPNLIVPGYTHQSTGSIIVDHEETSVHYVYAADGAECYHEYDCKFAFASSQRLTVYEAYHLGFRPCGRCNPPVYTQGSQLQEPGSDTDEAETVGA